MSRNNTYRAKNISSDSANHIAVKTTGLTVTSSAAISSTLAVDGTLSLVSGSTLALGGTSAMTLGSGDITSTSGDITLTAGDLTLTAGDLTVGGSLTVGGAAVSALASGSGTPTPTNNTLDVGAVGSAGQYVWLRVGNSVSVSGQIAPTFTAGSTPGTVNVPLPVASNFSASSQASGVVSSPTGIVVGSIAADPTNDELYLEVQSSATGTQTLTFHATYLVI